MSVTLFLDLRSSEAASLALGTTRFEHHAVPVVVEEPVLWSWTVATRFPMMPKQGPRVVVSGEHVGALPQTGQQVVVRHGARSVPATVDFLMRSEQRAGGNVSGYAWALVLRDVALDDIAVGSVVTYEPSVPTSE
jgi:hypothetical protein